MGREKRMVFKVGKGDSAEMLRTAGEEVKVDRKAEKDSPAKGGVDTRKELDNIFEGIPVDEKITAWIPTLKGNFAGIKEAEAALRKVRAATEQDIYMGGWSELSKKVANNEIDCNKFTELVNRLLKERGIMLKNIPGEIDCFNDPRHHIAIYKFPKINMIGAERA